MQNLSTLEEAAGELSTLTGKPWTTAKLLDYCAQNLIPLLAQVIIDANDIDALLLRHPKASTWQNAGSWKTYATMPPEALWMLRQDRTATIRHPADGPRSWPVRELPVTLEQVRVSAETLQRINIAYQSGAMELASVGPRATITLPAGTKFLPIEEIEHLMAYALWPLRDDGSPGDGLDYGFCCATLKTELAQAVESKELPVKSPLTFGPHTSPYGANVPYALVGVDDLRKYVAGRGILVAVDAPESEALPVALAPKADDHLRADVERERLLELVRLKARDEYDASKQSEVVNDDSEAIEDTEPDDNQTDAVDFDLLATRTELIDAFGKFTGMDASWFDNVKDTPKLLAARKLPGQGGRHSAEPLFCPFDVMLWLTDQKRRKGGHISNETAWRMLKAHFPKVYDLHSIGDPTAD